jgi:glycosyltransferase involved in cell wall biosynthesis
MMKIIIHFPFKIDRSRAAASQLRPIKIIETFKSLGYDVALVEGYGKERQEQIRQIKERINKGEKYEFVYSECNTTPTLLTEKHHYPTYPFLDFSFFKYCKNHGIKIGLFYRDIYWCFPENNHGLIRKIMKLFYLYDLHEYNKYVSTLFVPSFEMINHIQFKLDMSVTELYPGCEKGGDKNNTRKEGHNINILYVGGVGHHYDVSMIMEVVKNNPALNLTICCRPDDWDAVKDEYKNLMSDNISVVHKSGSELNDLYANADLFCLFVKPDKYREFAVPFKLFETIGYNCPIIASEGTWVAKFVKQNKIGFSCNYDRKSLGDLIDHISAHPDELLEVKANIISIADDNTWEARCKKIVSELS